MLRGWTGAGRRGALLALAAVLGVAGGVATALVVTAGGSAPVDGAAADPLRLGVALRSQDCSDDDILVVGWGSTKEPLAQAVARQPEARYFSAADSCSTYYLPAEGPDPAYVAYLGPYDDPDEACRRLMTARHRGDYVTRLTGGNESPVVCACELPLEELPRLSRGADVTASHRIWTRQLQDVLYDAGRNPRRLRSGELDSATVAMVRGLQEYHLLPTTGVADRRTWQALLGEACPRYSY